MAAHSTSQPHILPLRVYFSVFAALLVLTAITVYIAGFHFGPYNLVVAMAVAVVKASLVALIFMHLKYDNKLYAIAFVISLAMLAVFVVLTMFDTLARDRILPERDGAIEPEAIIYRPAADAMPVDSLAAAIDTTVADTAAGE